MDTLRMMKIPSSASPFAAFAPMTVGKKMTAMIRRTQRSQLGKALFVTTAVLIGLAIMTPRCYAGDVIYETKFESPTFVAGRSLVGQDGWTAPPPLSPDAALISTDRPRQGRQSVQVFGGNLVHQDLIYEATNGYYDAIGSYRKQVDYDTTGAKIVRVSAHVRLDGRQTEANDNFFSASIGALGRESNGNANGIGELAISSDGKVYGYSGTDLVPHFQASASVTLGEWHTLAVETNFATRTYSFFVDDRPLGTFAFDSSVTQNTFLRGSMLVYAAPDTTTNLKANYTAQFDRFVIEVIGQK